LLLLLLFRAENDKIKGVCVLRLAQ